MRLKYQPQDMVAQFALKKFGEGIEKAETILMKETIEEVKQKLSKFGCIHKSKVAHFTP